MAETPIFQRTLQKPQTNFAGSSQTLLNIADTGERLRARLQSFQRTAQAEAFPEITEETRLKAIKDVKEGRIDSNNVALVARDIYRNTANASLEAEVQTNSKEIGDRILLNQKRNNNYSIGNFTREWEGYEKGVLNTVKDPFIRKNIQNRLEEQKLKYTGQLSVLELKQTRALQKENLSSKLSLDIDSYKASFGVNSVKALEYQEEIDKTLSTMIEANLISKNTAELKRRNINKEVYLNNLKREFNESINTGTAHAYYDNFKKVDHFGVLTEDDISSFRNSMLTQMKTDIAAYDLLQKEEEEEEKKLREDTEKEFNTLWLSGDLSEQMVNDALTNGVITRTEHKEYLTKISDTGALVDNTGRLLIAKTHLLDITDDEILASPDFTNATKIDLINERKTIIEDRQNWLGTQTGREARRRIREAFNILDGTMLAKLDFNNKLVQEYDEVYRTFYAEVEALPIEQRESKSILIADKALSNYRLMKQEARTQRAKAAQDKKNKEEAQKEKDYQNSIYGKFMSIFQDSQKSADNKKSEFNKILEQFGE